MVEVQEEYKHYGLRFDNGYLTQLDIFIPELSLAFEYQGQQHFYDIYCFSSHSEYLRRDRQKQRACYLKGITLIEVPYWWDNQLDSLKTTIHYKRPDIIPYPGNGIPLPNQPPQVDSKNGYLCL